MQEISSRQRKRRLCYWDSESKIFDNFKAQVERYIRGLPDFDLAPIKGLDDPNFSPCDLVIIYAPSLDPKAFRLWLDGIHKRMETGGNIWTPAFIVSSQLENSGLERIHEFADTNWYFDIIHPDHWMSFLSV